MLAYVRNNLYLCKGKDNRGVATRRQGQTDSLSLLSFVGLTNNVGSMEQEIWKDIPGYEGYYQISNLGRVKSLGRVVTRGNSYMTLPEKIKATPLRDGYRVVWLGKNGSRSKLYFIHRLIAEAFIPNPENKPYIDHINSIRDDNRIENLHWVTHKENLNNPITKKKIQEGQIRLLSYRKSLGRKHDPKTVYQYTMDGEFVKEWFSVTDAERVIGVHGISLAARGLSHQCAGFRWTYEKGNLHININRSTRAVIQYSPSGELIKSWSSISAAGAALKINRSHICQCCMGKGKRAGGFVWKYAEAQF